MPSIKITVLAMASAVAAVPHYGAHSSAHSKYHSKIAHASGDVKPYPTGGWVGAFNSTRVAQASGTGVSDDDTTVDVTSTSTTTLVKTVVVKPTPAGAISVKQAAVNSGMCGPATITVTASEKVTVTVTPGGGADVPKSSVVNVESKSQGQGYGVPSSAAAAISSSAAAGIPSSVAPVSDSSKSEEVNPTPKPTPSPIVPSSKVEQVPTPAPVVPSSKAPEAAPSSQYEAPKPSSSVEKPVVSSAVASSAAPSKTPSTGGSYSGSKRGLAYNEAALCKTLGSKFGFGYNWGQVENNDIGTNFIPMMHRPSESTPEAWLKNVDKACNKGTKAVMGFNEPDIVEQANLTPEAACSAWKLYMNPIASSHPEVTIIGPSVSNSGASHQGLAWLQKFHDVCPDAIVHATNIHFYDIYEDATITRFKAQVEKAAALYNKPVWITEFGLNPGSATTEQAVKFLKEAMAYLDASDKVQGYSWFMVGSGENQLNVGNGLSAVGQAYAGGY